MRVCVAMILLMLQGFSAIAAETVTDAKGRTVAVNRPFTRIISLYSAHTENLVELGACDSIIGASRAEDRDKTKARRRPVFSTQA